MKVKKHLQIDAIMNSTGRLPSDMENLEVYHQSSSTGEPINVGEMDLTYLIRAFAKCQRSLVDNSPTEQYHNLHGKIEKLEKLLEEKDEIINKLTQEEHRWRKAYDDNCTLKGWGYVFSEIPNDASGRAFISQLREYLNTESYSVRVRGQYLNDETKQNEGWRPYSFGQPISKSKCLRVYVDTK